MENITKIYTVLSISPNIVFDQLNKADKTRIAGMIELFLTQEQIDSMFRGLMNGDN